MSSAQLSFSVGLHDLQSIENDEGRVANPNDITVVFRRSVLSLFGKYKTCKNLHLREGRLIRGDGPAGLFFTKPGFECVRSSWRESFGARSHCMEFPPGLISADCDGLFH